MIEQLFETENGKVLEKEKNNKKIINFESVLMSRAEETINRLKSNEKKEHIYRAEVALTEKCNLACSYCQKRKTI